MRRDVYQAIADPTRRGILVMLALHAVTPNAIAEKFSMSRQAVSKHMRILTECELVRPRPQGREIYYELKVGKLKEVDQWLERFRMIYQKKYSQLDSLLIEIKKTKK